MRCQAPSGPSVLNPIPARPPPRRELRNRGVVPAVRRERKSIKKGLQNQSYNYRLCTARRVEWLVKKRDQVLKTLYKLSQETDVSLFEQRLKELIASKDPEVLEFVQYFEKYYARHAERWGYCYRIRRGMNTNMGMETFHRMIRRMLCANRKKIIANSYSFSLSFPFLFPLCFPPQHFLTSFQKSRGKYCHLRKIFFSMGIFCSG